MFLLTYALEIYSNNREVFIGEANKRLLIRKNHQPFGLKSVKISMLQIIFMSILCCP